MNPNRTLDRFLPDFHFYEVHTTKIKAPGANVYRAVKEVAPRQLPLFRAMFAIRTLPAMLTRKAGIPYGGEQPLLEQMLASGFVLLAEEPGREIMVGAVGQFWKPFGRPLALANPQEYLAFDRPEYAKAAMSISLESDATKEQVIVSTETRVYVPHHGARARSRPVGCLSGQEAGLSAGRG